MAPRVRSPRARSSSVTRSSVEERTENQTLPRYFVQPTSPAEPNPSLLGGGANVLLLVRRLRALHPAQACLVMRLAPSVAAFERRPSFFRRLRRDNLWRHGLRLQNRIRRGPRRCPSAAADRVGPRSGECNDETNAGQKQHPPHSEIPSSTSRQNGAPRATLLSDQGHNAKRRAFARRAIAGASDERVSSTVVRRTDRRDSQAARLGSHKPSALRATPR